MVQAATPQTDTEAEGLVDDPAYHIDFEDDLDTLDFLIWQRLCWEGSCRFCKGQTEPKPVLPVKVRNQRISISAAIKQCAKQDTYILPNMSVTEVVFRLLLRNSNKPMTLSELWEEIDKEWQLVVAMKSITPESVRQILDGDNEYRICRTEIAAE